MSGSKLSSFGELALIKRIEKIVSAYSHHKLMLDDSALLSQHPQECFTWMTIDPCPIPNLVQHLGMGSYYHSGWLCVLKSLSDLAAMGAKPTGVMVSVDFPRETKVEDFDDFFTGVVECASSHSVNLVGGNIREAQNHPTAVCSAVGATMTQSALYRGQANPGDLIFIINRNEFGAFWAGIASHFYADRCFSLSDTVLTTVRESALRPKAMVREGEILLAKTRPSFCMDTSDGLISTILEMVSSARISARLSFDIGQFSNHVQKVADVCSCDVRTWAIGWGSHLLLCAGDQSTVSKAEANLAEIGSEIVVIGEIVAGKGDVYIDNMPISDNVASYLRGEQFRRDSFWQLGACRFANLILSKSLEGILNESNR